MRIDRQRGTLLGLAVGDALGAAVEFQMPGTFEPVTGYRAGGPHGLALGEWTDDSAPDVSGQPAQRALMIMLENCGCLVNRENDVSENEESSIPYVTPDKGGVGFRSV